jgi:Ras GTPase-activating-like protein IQGAP2/3
LDQYVALSKKDLSISISLNEIYNTHSLLLQHLENISPPDAQSNANATAKDPDQSYQISCHQLRSVLNDLGAAPAQLPRKDNKTIGLSLYSRWQTAPILFPHMVEAITSKDSTAGRARVMSPASPRVSYSGNELTEADILYMDTKTLIIQIMRKQAVLASTSLYENHAYMPVVSLQRMPSEFDIKLVPIDEILDRASSQAQDPVMLKRSIRTRQNLRILQDRYHYTLAQREAGYIGLAQDIFEEFTYFVSLMAKISAEIASLETVYRTICDHNQYLRSQLESYKAYLQNVRIQAAGGDSRWLGMPPVTTEDGKPILPPKREAGGVPGRTGSMSLRSGGTLSRKGNPLTGPVKFTHHQLEKDGVIVESSVPENRYALFVFFSITCPFTTVNISNLE